jgi:hypothetical protein
MFNLVITRFSADKYTPILTIRSICWLSLTRTGVNDKIKKNNDYIRVYGNVLPEHFLYEIDETDVVHETFEYEYKAKYTNDQVIPY